MKIKVAPLVVLLSILFFVGCSPKETENPPLDADYAAELSQNFINHLTVEILPNYDNEALLRRQEQTLVNNTITTRIDLVEQFVRQYKEGGPGMVDIAFSTDGFVVVRLVIEDGHGYYLRYQHDPKKEGEPLAIAIKSFSAVEYSIDEKQNKAELTLLQDKKTVAVFTMRNLERPEEE